MIRSDNKVIDHAAHGRLGAGAKTPEGLAASARNAAAHLDPQMIWNPNKTTRRELALSS